MTGLEVRGLHVRFGDLAAVDGVDLSVGEGEVLCLLGPSGCGKSTLLRAVAGLEVPDEGTISWDGHDLAREAPHRRRFGLVFQDYALFPHLDVAANVGFGLRMQGCGTTRTASRVAEVLELVGMRDAGGRSVGNLSGGEQQRVALGRALAAEPRLLLLDEPLAALDRALRSRLLDELVQLLDRLDVTAIHVTHDQEEAFALGDRVAVMEAGQVVQVGPPAEVWRAPASATVARFLGFPLLEGEVVGGAVRGRFGSLPSPGVPDGPAHVAVRPEALDLDPTSPLHGTVTGSRFRGDRVVVRVATVAGELEVAVAPGDAPAVGSVTSLGIDPSRVVVLAR